MVILIATRVNNGVRPADLTFSRRTFRRIPSNAVRRPRAKEEKRPHRSANGRSDAARLYDRVRPGYPEALFDDLARLSVHRRRNGY